MCLLVLFTGRVGLQFWWWNWMASFEPSTVHRWISTLCQKVDEIGPEVGQNTHTTLVKENKNRFLLINMRICKTKKYHSVLSQINKLYHKITPIHFFSNFCFRFAFLLSQFVCLRNDCLYFLAKSISRGFTGSIYTKCFSVSF